MGTSENKLFRKFFITVSILSVLLSASLSLSATNAIYQQRNLVSDGFVSADHNDSYITNAWGIAFNPYGFAWIADNGTGFSTFYDGSGNLQFPIVIIPPAAGSSDTGNPTGIVYNGSSDFVISQNDLSAPGQFIFSSENGTIAAWSYDVDQNHALLMVDNSSSGAVYKGLAIAANGTGNFLYATDFHNNKIDVFDKNFNPVTPPCSFVDSNIPAGFAPFGIQNLNGNIYVTYAKQNADKHDDVAGKGLGFVNVFDANGCFIKRFASGKKLNSPWGMAIAPADFGKFSNRLLVGNFGDGKINAYDIATGKFSGQLKQSKKSLLVIDGLWGISFGNGLHNQPSNALFFTAGPGEEAYGLFGRIEVAP